MQRADAPLSPHALVALARDLVLAPSHDAARALAEAVLARDEAARLALATLDGGPHAIRRAIELAALVLEREAATPVEAVPASSA